MSCPATYHPVGGGGVPDAPHMEANNFFSVVRLKTGPWRKGNVFPMGKREAGRRDAAPYGRRTDAARNIGPVAIPQLSVMNQK